MVSLTTLSHAVALTDMGKTLVKATPAAQREHATLLIVLSILAAATLVGFDTARADAVLYGVPFEGDQCQTRSGVVGWLRGLTRNSGQRCLPEVGRLLGDAVSHVDAAQPVLLVSPKLAGAQLLHRVWGAARGMWSWFLHHVATGASETMVPVSHRRAKRRRRGTSAAHQPA